MSEKRYIARRQCTSGHALAADGVIHVGQEFPAEEVTAALLDLHWVEEARPGELADAPAAKGKKPAKA